MAIYLNSLKMYLLVHVLQITDNYCSKIFLLLGEDIILEDQIAATLIFQLPKNDFRNPSIYFCIVNILLVDSLVI